MTKKIAISLIVAILVAAPVYAQTVPISQLGNVLNPSGGPYYSNSNTGDNNVWSHSAPGTRDETSPTITTRGPATVTTSEGFSGNSGFATWCPQTKTMNGGWTYPTNVNADCTPTSLSPAHGSHTTYGADIVTGGITTVIGTCETSIKTTSNWDFAGGTVDVSSSNSSHDGSC